MRLILVMILPAAVPLALAACSMPQDAAIDACETFIKARLRSPSTYQRIEASAFLAVDNKSGWANVEYDAANAYGTPIRDRQPCEFRTPGGQWPDRELMIQQARLMALDPSGICCILGGRADLDGPRRATMRSMRRSTR